MTAGPTGDPPLAGKVALVAGATRGAGRGFAVELGAAGATVDVTARPTRVQRYLVEVQEAGRPADATRYR